MTEPPPDRDTVRQHLVETWAPRSPVEIANQYSAPLFGSPGDWDLPADITPKRDLLYLAVGIPDPASLPRPALAAAAAETLARPGDVALRYGFGMGPAAIRDWLASRHTVEQAFAVTADWFQMTNGSSGAIDLIVRSLIDPGDVIIAETPTYMGTLHNFRGVLADVHFVPTDRDGMDAQALAVLLDKLSACGKRVKLIYVISAFQNPTGATLSPARRLHLLDLAARHQALLLDDEAYTDLWFDSPPPAAMSALAEGWGVITVGTFSKTVATGLRIGWIHAEPGLLALFSRMRFGIGQNQLGLRIFEAFLTGGAFAPHPVKVRAVYAEKYRLLHEAFIDAGLDSYLEWSRPTGGFYLWAKLKAGITLDPLWRTATEEGIAINRGSGFTAHVATDAEHIRVAFPWPPASAFAEAARRLRIACDRVASAEAA